jgi:hypothetical protein
MATWLGWGERSVCSALRVAKKRRWRRRVPARSRSLSIPKSAWLRTATKNLHQTFTTGRTRKRKCLQMQAFRDRPKFDRRGGDSNPRDPCGPTGFRNRPVQPLRHLSGKEAEYSPARARGKARDFCEIRWHLCAPTGEALATPILLPARRTTAEQAPQRGPRQLTGRRVAPGYDFQPWANRTAPGRIESRVGRLSAANSRLTSGKNKNPPGPCRHTNM